MYIIIERVLRSVLILRVILSTFGCPSQRMRPSHRGSTWNINCSHLHFGCRRSLGFITHIRDHNAMLLARLVYIRVCAHACIYACIHACMRTHVTCACMCAPYTHASTRYTHKRISLIFRISSAPAHRVARPSRRMQYLQKTMTDMTSRRPPTTPATSTTMGT